MVNSPRRFAERLDARTIDQPNELHVPNLPPTAEAVTPGDADAALVALVAGAQPALRAYLHALIRQGADVDDVLQETNVVLWKRRREYDPARDFLRWACTVARYQALAWLKRQRRESVPLDEALFDSIADSAARYVERAESRLRALRECLAKLPPHYRELVDRRYLAGEPVTQIAAARSRSADAISMMLYRARQQLLSCIELALVRGSMA